MSYYAIQDTNAGFIQYVVQADSPMAAIAAFDSDVGIDPHGLGLEKVAEELETTEITAELFAELHGVDGTWQPAIDKLEAFKAL